MFVRLAQVVSESMFVTRLRVEFVCNGYFQEQRVERGFRYEPFTDHSV